MVVTTAVRTTAKLERKVFEPHWLREVVDDGDAGFLIESGEQIAYVNRAYALLLGYGSPEQLRGQHLSIVVADEDSPRLLAYSRLRIRDEAAPRQYDFAARHRDASPVRLHATVSASRVEQAVVITTMVLPCERPETLEASPLIWSGGTRPPQRLSPRETEVMERILAGQRTKEIAFALDLSPKTVSTHRTRMLEKLNLNSNRDLFQYAVNHHLIDWS